MLHRQSLDEARPRGTVPRQGRVAAGRQSAYFPLHHLYGSTTDSPTRLPGTPASPYLLPSRCWERRQWKTEVTVDTDRLWEVPALDPHELDAWLVAGSPGASRGSARPSPHLKDWFSEPSCSIWGIGLLVGEAGFGFEFSNAELTQNLGLLALALILAEGGLTTTVGRGAARFAVCHCVSTVGVLVSVTVVAAGAYFLLDFSTQQALLLGAVVSSTDAAAVFSVLRNIPLPRRLTSALEAESGFNDAPVVILVTLLSSDAWQETSVWETLFTVLSELAIGAAVGLVVAGLGQLLLSRISLPAGGLVPTRDAWPLHCCPTPRLGCCTVAGFLLFTSPGFG